MITSRRSELHHWMLVWGAAAGLAGIPAEMAAQSGLGQPRGRLDTWMAAARASAFHASIQADPMANPVPGHAGQTEAWTPASIPAATDSMASHGSIYLNTLLAAFIPMVPGMIVGAGPTDWSAWLASLGLSLLGAGVTLVSVPVTAIKTANVRVDKGKLILGVALGSVVGGLASLLAAGATDEWALIAPVYSLVVAGFATATTVPQG